MGGRGCKRVPGPFPNVHCFNCPNGQFPVGGEGPGGGVIHNLRFVFFYINTFWGLKIRSLLHELRLQMIHATGTLQFMIFFHLKVLLHCAIHIFIHEIHCYYISLSVVYWFPINTFQAEEVRKRMGENEEVTNEFWPTRIVADFGDSDYHGMCELWWRNLIPFCCQCHRYDSLCPCSGVFF